MSGTLSFPSGDTATLDDNGVWSCSDPVIQTGLNTLFNPSEDYSPADGFMGAKALNAAAKAFGAQAKHNPRPPGSNDVVY